jgi:hypothetical protein
MLNIPRLTAVGQEFSIKNLLRNFSFLILCGKKT